MPKKKVLLLQPKNLLHLNNYPPLGLVCVGSALEKAGYDVKIIPTARVENYEDIIKEEIRDCLFVGVTVLTSETPHAIELSEFIKSISPQTPIVWGGWHTTLFPEQVAGSNIVDYAVVGDGDELIVDLARKLGKGERPKERVLVNKGYVDIEKLPDPDYDLVMKIEQFINDDLTDKFNEYVEGRIRWVPYQSSRGCPHRCKFCINVVTNNQFYRKKSAEKTVKEMERIIKKWDINHLKVIDDNFFVDIKRVRKICQLIISKGLKFTWDAECRVDYFRDGFVDEQTLKILKEAGLIQLTLGLESGSEDSLNRMSKDIHVEQSVHAVSTLDSMGIVPRTSFIIDIPGDTTKDLLQTQKLLNRLRKYKMLEAGMATYRPYPKSDLCNILLDAGYFREPKTLMEWKDVKNVMLYGIYDTKKPWQKNYGMSTNLAFFNSVESSVWLRDHQLKNPVEKLMIRTLRLIAKARNRAFFYHLTIDRIIYTKLRNHYYLVRELQARKNEIPAASRKDEEPVSCSS